MKFLNPSVQSYCFYAALITYGCFSSPTPDGFGIAEIIIALLLCLSIRMVKQEGLNIPLIVAGYGLSIPIIVALINGNHPFGMVRDIVPFFYLMMPLFWGATICQSFKKFLVVLTGVGILFSVRTIFAHHSVLLHPALWGLGPPADLLYLANSPEVLFSALFCIGQGGKKIMEKGCWLQGVALILLSSLPLLAMMLMMQRAGVGAVAVYVLMAIAVVLYRAPKWGMALIGGVVAIIFLALPIFEHITMMVWQKTEIVGLNSRVEEWMAVFDILSKGWENALFGEGWGGRIENPAVGGINVNYTHSFISSLLLKTGMVGAAIILVGCFMPFFRSVGAILTKRRSDDLIIWGATIFPFLISIFLYASYKSLGFGLILLVFFIFSIRKLEKNEQFVS